MPEKNDTINDIITASRFFGGHGRRKNIKKLEELAHIVNSQINAAETALHMLSSLYISPQTKLSQTGVLQECSYQIFTFLPSTEELDQLFADPDERALARQAVEQFIAFKDKLDTALNSPCIPD